MSCGITYDIKIQIILISTNAIVNAKMALATNFSKVYLGLNTADEENLSWLCTLTYINFSWDIEKININQIYIFQT